MRKITLFFSILFKLFLLSGQTIYNVSGYIYDSQTGEVLINAIVMDEISQKSTYTNNYGYYNFKLSGGENNLVISYTGTKNVISIKVLKDTVINIHVNTAMELNSVLVTSEKQSVVNRKQPGMMNLSLKAIESTPQLMGERDVLKAVQLMPGVHAASEGSTDMVAWGGNTDQNLVLLDGVPIYNPNHIFGFFSVFNDDAINAAKVYIGDIPARYNGRLSSVTDIRMREGNNQEYHCKGTAGTMSAKILAEGPLVKGKSSFLVTGRVSYLELLAQPLMKHFTDFDGADYNFYDITVKVNYSLNANNKLFLSFYNGEDYGRSEKDLVFGTMIENTDFSTKSVETNKTGWGNSTAALRWNYIFSGKAFANLTLDYDNYFYSNRMVREETYKIQNQSDTSSFKNTYALKSNSKIGRIGFSYDLTFPLMDRNEINTGIHVASLKLSPISQSSSNSSGYRENVEAYSTLEFSPYFEDKIKPSKNVELQLGVNAFIIKAGDKLYNSLLPRVSATANLSDKLSVNAAYIEMGQNVQLLSHNRISLSSDLWVPVTETVKPQYSKQVSAGFTVQLPFELVFRTTGFYKHMTHLLAFKEGTVFDDFISWQQQVIDGNGRAYGVDLMLERSLGRFSGWIACTWSRSFRKYSGLNNGNEFFYRYDRPVDMKVAIMYKLSATIDFGAVWVLSSGSVETVGSMAYVSNFEKGMPKYSNVISGSTYGENITIYQYNALRTQAYHRLDIACNFHFDKPKFKSTMSLGAYNAYNRTNPYSVMLSRVWVNRYYYSLNYQSLFGIIPYVNYSFNF